MVDALYRDFGRRLRKQRQHAHLTQVQLAERVGLSRTSITNIEKGIQHIPLHLLFELAKAVGVSPDELLPDGRSGEGAPAVNDKEMRRLSVRDQEWVLRVMRAGATQTEEDPRGET